MVKNWKLGCSAVLAMALLAGCGGGGGDDGGEGTPVAPVATAEGAYEGAITSGSVNSDFQLLVLENGEFWALYGTNYQGILYVSGLIQAQGDSSNGSFTADEVRDFWSDGTVVSGSVSATYKAGRSISGSVSAPAGTSSFTGAAIVATDYNYDTPAMLSSITGAWALTGTDGSNASITISALGDLNGTSLGCGFSGTVLPRASGKNVFDLQLQFGASPCAFPGQTAKGIALLNGERQLTVAGVNAQRTAGLVLFGGR